MKIPVLLSSAKMELSTSKFQDYTDWFRNLYGHCILTEDYTSRRVGYDEYEMHLWFPNAEDALAFRLTFGL